MASPDGDDGFLRSKGGGGVDTVDNGEGQSCTDSVTKGILAVMSLPRKTAKNISGI